MEAYHSEDTFLSEAITLEMNKAISKACKKKKPFMRICLTMRYMHRMKWTDGLRIIIHNLKGTAFATLVEGMDKSLGDLVPLGKGRWLRKP